MSYHKEKRRLLNALTPPHFVTPVLSFATGVLVGILSIKIPACLPVGKLQSVSPEWQ